MAAADVAQAVVDVTIGPALQGARKVAGPEAFALDELGKITLAAGGDQRTAAEALPGQIPYSGRDQIAA